MPGDEMKKGRQHVFEIIHVDCWYHYILCYYNYIVICKNTGKDTIKLQSLHTTSYVLAILPPCTSAYTYTFINMHTHTITDIHVLFWCLDTLSGMITGWFKASRLERNQTKGHMFVHF